MPLLEFQNITKRFGPVEVLSDVSFALQTGSILGLVGENGSGKSTSMNILGGVHRPTSGQILLDGKIYAPTSPRDAQDAGIQFIHQELNLFENLSIAENLFIGKFPRRHRFWPFIHRQEIHRRTQELLETVQVAQSPATPVNRLSPGERQLVEIAKAINAEARIIILDEPTTSLTHREIEGLFKIIARLKDRGISMIYISHVLQDVLQLCDDIAILRNGRVVSAGASTEYDAPKLVSEMVGRNIDQLYPERNHEISEQPLLCVRHLSQPGVVHDISLEVRAGEVLGLAGLMGAGRSELVRILFGLDPFVTGEIEILGERLTSLSPQRCIRQGMALITEDRRREGLMMTAPILENIALPSLGAYSSAGAGWLHRGSLAEAAVHHNEQAQVGTNELRNLPVQNLSGGNQQKVVIAKWLMCNPRVFILDEPTRGIDIGAKHEIYKLINQLVEEDACVLMISSEIEELTGMCDRILVMSRGEVRADFTRAQFDSRQILEAALWTH